MSTFRISGTAAPHSPGGQCANYQQLQGLRSVKRGSDKKSGKSKLKHKKELKNTNICY